MKRELAELILNPESVTAVDPNLIPAFIISLSSLQASLAAQLEASKNESDKAPANGDRLVGIEEASQKTGLTTDWLYRHADSLPFVKRVGRSVRFSYNGMEKFIRQR